jgi:hypothetical protein
LNGLSAGFALLMALSLSGIRGRFRVTYFGYPDEKMASSE